MTPETPRATIITDGPIVDVLAEMQLNHAGVMNMAKWVERYRPQCVPATGFHDVFDLLPHDGTELAGPASRPVTDNELLCELAGRKCFDATTEVLTPTGWVAFPALARGTAVATYRAADGYLEFQVPTDYIEKRHIGKMYTVESRACA